MKLEQFEIGKKKFSSKSYLIMGILESCFWKSFVFEMVLKNLEIIDFLKSQKTTRATFLRCGTPSIYYLI
ncbi:MAG TPA: hypothetical protein PKD83_12535 [Ignavibacteria bacterium]|nr:hypothetical protein [Ignavibacteria bacterium]